MVAVSIYVRIDNDVAFRNAKTLVDELEPLIAASRGKRLVIGGDFNAWDQRNDGRHRRWQVRWLDLWSRLEALGMVNLLRETHAARVPLEGCGCGFGDGCWRVQTVRRSSKALADYLWVTPDLVRGCKVDVMDINDSELLNVSDHAPVWADLVL